MLKCYIYNANSERFTLMAGIKNSLVAGLLKRWLKESGITQAQLAIEEEVTQVVISRQLSGQESIPLDRVKKIIKLTNPPPSELAKISRFLPSKNSTQYQRDMIDMHSALDSIGWDQDLYILLLNWIDIPQREKSLYITPLLSYIDKEAELADEEYKKVLKRVPTKKMILGSKVVEVPVRNKKGLIPDPDSDR